MAAYPNYYPNYYGNSNPNNVQELQNLKDRIDKQIIQMQNPQPFPPQPPQIQQTFQLSNPQQATSDFDAKYTDGVDEVRNTLALRNTLFLSKDMNTMWYKDVSGNVKTYSLTEVIEKDEKDIKIDELTRQLEDMKMLMATQLAQIQPNSTQPTIEQPTTKTKEETKTSKK